MYEYISYIFIILFIILFLCYSYIKIKYGFWVMQPVFHIYDIFYMIWPPGIINHNLPEKNKYTNFKNIETIAYDKLSDLQLNKVVNFIKLNYLQNKAPKIISVFIIDIDFSKFRMSCQYSSTRTECYSKTKCLLLTRVWLNSI
jgi:hypothetical protein